MYAAQSTAAPIVIDLMMIGVVFFLFCGFFDLKKLENLPARQNLTPGTGLPEPLFAGAHTFQT
jgi:hypothetical protein